jgi:uncharacterized membrane protein
MPRIAVLVGSLLIVLGVASYLLTGRASMTALIPAFFGLPILILGWLALRVTWRRHAMHAAAALGLLGLIGSLRGVPATLALLSGETVERPTAVVAQSVMAVICLVFVVMAVRSFVAARRARAKMS